MRPLTIRMAWAIILRLSCICWGGTGGEVTLNYENFQDWLTALNPRILVDAGSKLSVNLPPQPISVTFYSTISSTLDLNVSDSEIYRLFTVSLTILYSGKNLSGHEKVNLNVIIDTRELNNNQLALIESVSGAAIITKLRIKARIIADDFYIHKREVPYERFDSDIGETVRGFKRGFELYLILRPTSVALLEKAKEK